MKKILILNQDGVGLFDTLPQNISAKISPVMVGSIRTNFYKLTANNGEYDFLVGIFDNKRDAEKNLLSLDKTLKKAYHNKFKYDGWQSTDGEITALELLDEIEHADRHKDNFLDVAKKILNADKDIPF